jgi:hypothetical protein
MVDINLFGEDSKEQEPEQDRGVPKDTFSDTYSSDTSELTSESNLSDSGLDNDIYGKNYGSTGSRKGLFIGLAFVIVAIIAVIGWLMMDFGKEKPKEKKEVAAKVPEAITKTTPDLKTEPPISKPLPEVPQYVKRIVTSSQNGVKVVEKILNNIPKEMKFTLIQYRDGNFLTEVLGNNSANFKSLNSQLNSSIPNGEIKIVSQDNRNVQGKNYKQSILSGKVSAPPSDAISAPNYKDRNSIKNDFSNFCKEAGLKMRQFDIGAENPTAEYVKSPVLFRATGSKEGIIAFLQMLIEKNINVNLSKIVLIGSNQSTSDKNITLNLNLEIYHPI